MLAQQGRLIAKSLPYGLYECLGCSKICCLHLWDVVKVFQQACLEETQKCQISSTEVEPGYEAGNDALERAVCI